MYVIGITGPIGHGKSTLATALIKAEPDAIHLESSMIVTEVANEWMKHFPKELLVNEEDLPILNHWTTRLATIVSAQLRAVPPGKLEITNKTLRQDHKLVRQLFVYIDLIRQGVVPLGVKIDEDNKDKHRALLQWIGGFLVERVDPGIWYDEIDKRIKETKKSGAKLCVVGGIRYPYDAEVIRKNEGTIVQLLRKDLPERETEDITEQHRFEIRVDTTVHSDASKAALSNTAEALYEDLKNGSILRQYNTDDFVGL